MSYRLPWTRRYSSRTSNISCECVVFTSVYTPGDICNLRNNRDPSAIKHEPLDSDELPTLGMLVAIDAEFVSMQQVGTVYPSCCIIPKLRLGGDRVQVWRDEESPSARPSKSCTCFCIARRWSQTRRTFHWWSHTHKWNCCWLLDRVLWHQA